MKKIILLMTLVLALSLGFGERSFAMIESESTNDGVQVEIRTASNAYAAGDEIDLIVNVSNNSVYNLEEVDITTILPEGISMVDETEEGTFGLAPGVNVEVELKLQADRKPILDVFGDMAEEGEDKEKDSMPIILAIAFFAIVLLAVIILLVKKKGNGGAESFIFMCVILLTSGVMGDKVCATIQNKISVPLELEIDGNELVGSVEVSYSYEPVEFETEIDVKAGDLVKFEDDVIFFMKNIERVDGEDFQGNRLEYSISVKDEEYSESCFLGDDGTNDIWADTYNPYKVKFVADENNNIRMQIMEPEEVAPALQLSGNAEDVYVTEKYEYIEGDNYIIYLDKNVKVKGDLAQNIEIIMEEVEEQTGYSFDVDNKFSRIKVIGTRENYFEEGAFDGVDPSNEKIGIYVSYEGVYAGLTGSGYLVLDPSELEFDRSDAGTLVYDLCQVVQFRNGSDLGVKLGRGYAFFMTERVLNNLDGFEMNFYEYYSHYNALTDAIPASKAEELFVEYYEVVNYDADYGYRFMHFIHETYGESVFHNLLEKVSERDNNLGYYANMQLVLECLKDVTSDDVFEKFGEWHEKNRTYFESPYKR